MQFTVEFDLANSPSLNDLSAGAQAEVLRLVNAAAQSWSNHIRDNYLSNLVVTIGIRVDASAYGQSVIAQGAPEAWQPWTYQNFSTQVYRGTAESKISTNIDSNGGNYDIILNLTPFAVENQLFFRPDPLNPTAIPADKYDAMSVFLREIGHGLGIMAFSNAITDPLFQTDRTHFESHVRLDSSGNTIFNGGSVDDVPEGETGIILDPNNIGYFKEDGNFGDDLMSAVLEPGEIVGISEIDLAVLKDILVPILEPSNIVDVIDTIHDTWGSTRDLHLLNGSDRGYAAPDGSRLFGDGGNDQLYGNLGDDYLDGGTENDFMWGAAGNDTYVVDDPLDRVYEYAGEGIDRVKVGFSYTLGDHVEELEVTGSQAVTATGNSLDNYLIGNGNSILIGLAGDDKYWVSLDTVIEAAGEGHDRVLVSVDHFTLPDNVEDLELYPVESNASWGDFSATGNGLDNFLKGNVKNNQLDGAGGDDTLDGGGGDDILIGGSGNDTLRGGDGDTLIGGTGDDTYIFEDQTDAPNFIVVENADEGHDTIHAYWNFWMGMPNVEDLVLEGTGDWIGYGNGLDNVIKGNSGHNYLTGDGGGDHLFGFGGDDIIIGNDGDDTLEGGVGLDTLLGEDGDDTLIDTDYGSLWGGAGDDTLIGSGDPDIGTTAFYSGAFSDYEIRRLDPDHVRVRDLRPGSPDGTDTLSGITQLAFSSGMVPLGATPVVALVGPVDSMHGQALNTTDLFPISDPDTDVGIKVQIRDLTSDPQSGHFTINGVAQPANTVIELWQLPFEVNTHFVTGLVGDILEVRVFDGATWSAADGEPWTRVNINILPNNAPIVTTQPTRVAAINQTLSFSSLFNAYDLEGDVITKYQIRDKNAGANSGYVKVDGVVQTADTVIEITKVQLAQTQFVVGTTSDNLEIRAFDGIDWSAPANSGWASVTVLPATGTAGNDSILGTDGPDVINGLDGDDYLAGLGGDDIVNGGGGNDTLVAGGGNDVLNGGSGIDMATFSNPFGSYTVNLTAGTAITNGSSHTLIDVENVAVFGSGNGITVVGDDGNNEIAVFSGGPVSVSAGGGDDTVVDSYNILSTLDGGSGTDTLYLTRLVGTSLSTTFTPGGYGSLQDGTTYADFEALGLMTGAGNDSLTLYQPNILLDNSWDAGGGTDTVTLNLYATTFAMKMAAPQTTSTGTSATVEIYSRRSINLSNIENYRVIAGSADDRLTGGNGSDVFAGNGGNDTLNGGAGMDVARYSGLAANYRIIRDSGTTAQIVDLRSGSPDGTDTLSNIERLQWLDGSFTDLVSLPITTPNAIPGTNGKADILLQNDNGQVVLWRMNGAMVQASGALPQVTADWKVKEKADFNGDGKADILWQNDDGRAAIWMMNGNTMIAGSGSLDISAGSWRIRTAGDFNGDGKADIAWQNGAGQTVIWLMNGTGLVGNSGPLDTSAGGWQVKASGDFNGDGKADLLWQSPTGQAAIWLMSGTAMQAGSGGLTNVGADWKVKETGDFNGDGKSDILWQNDNGQAAIWLMNGTTMLGGSGALPTTGPEWQVKSTGDYNSDGKSDIAWQNANGQGALWLMSGASLLPGSGQMPTTGTEWHLAT